MYEKKGLAMRSSPRNVIANTPITDTAFEHAAQSGISHQDLELMLQHGSFSNKGFLITDEAIDDAQGITIQERARLRELRGMARPTTAGYLVDVWRHATARQTRIFLETE